MIKNNNMQYQVYFRQIEAYETLNFKQKERCLMYTYFEVFGERNKSRGKL